MCVSSRTSMRRARRMPTAPAWSVKRCQPSGSSGLRRSGAGVLERFVWGSNALEPSANPAQIPTRLRKAFSRSKSLSAERAVVSHSVSHCDQAQPDTRLAPAMSSRIRYSGVAPRRSSGTAASSAWRRPPPPRLPTRRDNAGRTGCASIDTMVRSGCNHGLEGILGEDHRGAAADRRDDVARPADHVQVSRTPVRPGDIDAGRATG